MGAMVTEGNSTNGTDEDDVSRPPRMVFLALIMLLSCVVNVFLLCAVLHNRKAARHSVQSVAVINLMAACLGDCLLNMSLVMGSLAAGSDWGFSDALCKWHSFVMNLVPIETALMLTLLTCDRYLVVRFPDKYDVYVVSPRLAVVVVFTWVQALSFSVPFLFDVVETTFRPKLHTCSVSDNTPLGFICTASVLCFLVPAVLIIVMFVLIVRVCRTQRQEVKTIITQNHYTDQVKVEPRLWREMVTVKYVAVLCCLWFLLQTPYVVITYIQQYRLSSQLSFSVDYPWSVDVAFIWMRFSFSAVFPCVTFVWKKELWHSCKQCLLCHRSNSVLDIKVTVDPTAKTAPAGRKVPPSPKLPAHGKDRDQAKQEAPNLLSFHVPVLFATADGIHIETPHNDVPEDSSLYQPKGRQLDITDQLPVGDLPEDTSDYDSSVDTENNSSQPLSTRHIRGALEASSMPDIRQDEHNERGTPADSGPLACSQGTDSGLELSGTVGSRRGRTLREQVASAPECDSVNSKNSGTIDFGGKCEVAADQTNSSVRVLIPSANTDCLKDSNAALGKKPASKDADNNVSGIKTAQSCAPSTLPKVHGRLKPLKPGKINKAKKTQADWPERKVTMKSAATKNEGASSSANDTTTRKVSTNGSVVTESGTGQDQRADERPTKSSRGNGGRGGHRRTMTSDSERALLSSDSSMELQNLKTRSCDAHSDKRTV